MFLSGTTSVWRAHALLQLFQCAATLSDRSCKLFRVFLQPHAAQNQQVGNSATPLRSAWALCASYMQCKDNYQELNL